MRRGAQAFAALFLAAVIVLAQGAEKPVPRHAAPSLSDARAKHILYGDKTGGGHLHGQNAPCKSEFPAGWDAQDIIANVTRAAANDNISWQAQRNGYLAGESVADNVRMRIVLSGDGKNIITAYPLDVRRNPCPRAANDNIYNR